MTDKNVSIEMTLEQASTIFDILANWQNLNKGWLELEEVKKTQGYEFRKSVHQIRYEESKELLGLFAEANELYDSLESE